MECYEYDDLNRLTTAFTSDEDTGNPDDCSDGYVNVGQGAYDHTYGYNAIGNLTSVDGANWSYGAGSAGPHALTAAPGASFSYDNTGRQTSRTINTVTTTIGWTPTGMTDTVTTGADTTSYLYTADGEQVAREDPDTTITLRVADLWETDGTTTKTYLSFAGVPVAVDVETTGTERTWLISDLLGTNSVLHNTTSGNTRIWYDPWGAERASTGTPATDYGYTGQHTEPTGLIDYNARQYDPEHKTFTSPDPIIPNPANPQTLNRYAYVNNNPTTYTDPTGHVADFCGFGNPGGCGSVDAVIRQAAINDLGLELYIGAVEQRTLVTNIGTSTFFANFVLGALSGIWQLSGAPDYGLDFSIGPMETAAIPFEIGELVPAVVLLIAGLTTRSPAAAAEVATGGIANANRTGAQIVDDVLRQLPRGKHTHVKLVESADELDDIFRQLSVDATPRAGATYPGKMARHPDGTTIGIRPDYAIDIKLPNGDIRKVHIARR